MAKLGNTVQNQGYAPAIDYFSGTGSQTAFKLTRPVASVAQVTAYVNNVPQNSGQGAFTIDLNIDGYYYINFSGAPSTGTNNIWVQYTSLITQVIAPGQATVTTTALIDKSVTPSKLANSGYELGMRNRIIKGAMMIDQRNAGASVTPAQDNYMVDRWKWGNSQASKFTAQQSTTAPSGFINSLLMTVSSSVGSLGATDYFTVYQPIEGLNVADLAWGTASASAVTLSFWARSSLTGTFGGSVRNSVGNRSYPFLYTISSANTFEYKTVTIAGDTTGTWLTTNGVGIYLQFGLGVGSTLSGTAGSWAGSNYLSTTGATSVVGTSGATFYITGVQLEKGSTATSFDYRPYGQELALCQRYYEKSYSQSQVPGTVDDSAALWGSVTSDSTLLPLAYGYKVTKRAIPTVTIYNSATETANSFQTGSTNYTVSAIYGSDAILGRVYSTAPMGSNTYSRVCFVASAEL